MVKKVIALFDVDGTLTPARKDVTPDVLDALKALRGKITIGFVGGSDLSKQVEQLGDNVIDLFDYCFAENGLVAYKDGKELARKSLADAISNDELKSFINFVLQYLATEVDCPVKRGTFIEYRTGMINISPIGRNCSREERNAFEIYDKEHKIRSTMVSVLKSKFPSLPFTYSIGGQISFDVFPTGWDKTYCLQFLEEFDEIHFFGDKTFEGGNDYEIFTSERTIGHTVTSPKDTLKLLNEIWGI